MTLDALFQGYLLAWTFWAGLGIGCMGILFIQYLTGGNWGLALRHILEAGTATVPVLAILFLPLLLGLPRLYAWARPSDVAADPVLQHKAIYLNIPFFTVRSFLYLIVWIILAILVRRWSAGTQRDAWQALRRMQTLSIIGSLLLGLTVTFAAIDWLMSLDATWYSTMYPPLVAMSFLLAAFGVSIVALAIMAPRTDLGAIITPQVLNDLGSLLLAFLMLWAYMQYFQYMLIWAGNLSDEIPFYLRRVQAGWQPVAIAVAAFGFFVPFWFLLFRPLKRNPRTLAAIAFWIVVMHLVNVYWLVVPPFAPEGPSPTLADLLCLLVLGAVWLGVFVSELRRRPLLARDDVRLAPALEAAHEAA